MAKLDDFGRPIYETAEEYNRAHKGGVCPRPYDSPEGENYQKKQSAAQRHSLQEGRYKAKVIIGGVIGVFAIIYFALFKYNPWQLVFVLVPSLLVVHFAFKIPKKRAQKQAKSSSDTPTKPE